MTDAPMSERERLAEIAYTTMAARMMMLHGAPALGGWNAQRLHLKDDWLAVIDAILADRDRDA
jgi:hypothetical protein